MSASSRELDPAQQVEQRTLVEDTVSRVLKTCVLPRRGLGKFAIGIGAALLGAQALPDTRHTSSVLGINEVSADGGVDIPTEPTPTAEEWMNLDFQEQAKRLSTTINVFKHLGDEDLYGMTEGYLSQLEQSQRWGLRPPEITRDPVQAQIDLQLPFYLADVSDGTLKPRRDIGMVVYDKPGAITPDTGFGFYFDAVPLGITNHIAQSETHGPLNVQLIHLGGRHGNDNKDSWVITAYLGYIAANGNAKTEPQVFKESTDPEDNVWPYRNPGETVPSYDYQHMINRVLDTRAKGVLSSMLGISYDSTNFEGYPDKPEMYQKDFFLKNSQHSRAVYDWMVWRTLRAAVTDQNRKNVLVSLGQQGYNQIEIGDIFPEVIGEDVSPPSFSALWMSDILKRDDDGKYIHEELTMDQLQEIPRFYFRRIAESPHDPLVTI